jgi:hypothetical protein
MPDIRELREFTPEELEVVDTLEQIIAKYNELLQQYLANPSTELLAMSVKIDELRFTTAAQLSLAAWRCDFSQATQQHKFCVKSDLLAKIE